MKKNPASSYKMIKGTLGFLLVVGALGYGGNWAYNKYGTKVSMSGGSMSDTAYGKKHIIATLSLTVREENNVFLTGSLSNTGDRQVNGVRVSLNYGELQNAARGKGWPSQIDLGGIGPGETKRVNRTAFKLPGEKVTYFPHRYRVWIQRVFM